MPTLEDYELMLAELKAERNYEMAKFNRKIADLNKQIELYKAEIVYMKTLKEREK